MRLRDSAVPILAGWILLAPSIDCARNGLEKETPLSEWETVDTFESQARCEDYRATVIATEKAEDSSVYADRYSYSICLSTNDPRLKE